MRRLWLGVEDYLLTRFPTATRITTPSQATSLLTGDTLFRGGIGRWDLGGTSMEDIVASIHSKLMDFPDATRVIPGHGPSTTIGSERGSNPYLVTR